MRAAGKIVRGRRRCSGCGYSLTGQGILHDAQEEIFLVRCPECGRAAAISDHPILLGHQRLVAVSAAMTWWMTIGLLWLIGGQTLHFCCASVPGAAVAPYGARIMEIFQAAQAAAKEPVPAPFAIGDGSAMVTPAPGGGFWTWWAAQDHDAIVRALGGRGALWSAEAVIPLAFAALLAAALGLAWSLILADRRPLARKLWPAILILPVALLVVRDLERMRAPPLWEYAAAEAQLGAPWLIGSALIVLAILSVLVLWGAPVARWIVNWTWAGRGTVGSGH